MKARQTTDYKVYTIVKIKIKVEGHVLEMYFPNNNSASAHK